MNSCNGKPPAKIPDEVAVPYSISNVFVQLSMIPDNVKTHHATRSQGAVKACDINSHPM